MSKDNFCCVGDFPVLIPYKELERLLEVARNLEGFEQRLSRTNEQLAALRLMHSELMEKVRELQKMV